MPLAATSSATPASRRPRGPAPRGTCPDCGADVAVNTKGQVMCHGRSKRRDARGEWIVTFGCRGWGKEALDVRL